MKEFMAFFGELIVILAVSGMFYALAPEGTQKKYIQFAISLCVLTALVGPMLSVVSSLPELLEDTEFEIEENEAEMKKTLEEAVISASRENIENSIKSLLAEKFALEKDTLSVSVVLDAEDTENIKIVSVTVTAPNTSAAMRSEMKRYLSEQLLHHGEIEITNKE